MRWSEFAQCCQLQDKKPTRSHAAHGNEGIIYSFPCSAWERNSPTLCVEGLPTGAKSFARSWTPERPPIAFPRGAWERGTYHAQRRISHPFPHGHPGLRFSRRILPGRHRAAAASDRLRCRFDRSGAVLSGQRQVVHESGVRQAGLALHARRGAKARRAGGGWLGGRIGRSAAFGLVPRRFSKKSPARRIYPSA